MDYKESKLTPVDGGTVTLAAQWTPNTNTGYTVGYYYQTNGAYPAAAESIVSRTGTTGTKVSVTESDKTPAKTGYVPDEIISLVREHFEQNK